MQNQTEKSQHPLSNTNENPPQFVKEMPEKLARKSVSNMRQEGQHTQSINIKDKSKSINKAGRNFKSNQDSYRKCQIIQANQLQIQPIHTLGLKNNHSSKLLQRNIKSMLKDKRRKQPDQQIYHTVDENISKIFLNLECEGTNNKQNLKKFISGTKQQIQNLGKLSWTNPQNKREKLRERNLNLLQDQDFPKNQPIIHQKTLEYLCGNMLQNAYNIIQQNKKKSTKKLNWFSNFVTNSEKTIKSDTKATQKIDSTNNDSTKNQQLNEEEDSLEYIDEKTPGPGSYLQQSMKSSGKKSALTGTFGNSSRFHSIRPATALVQYCQNVQSISKNASKININTPQNVSFGTSKTNPRSEIKKIEYCDWIRPHQYIKMPNLASKSKKQDPIYLSTLERFKSPALNYNGPDYYDKQIKKNQDKESGLPAHYFLSQVQKGLKTPPTDKRNYFPDESRQKNLKKSSNPKSTLSKAMKVPNKYSKEFESTLKEQIFDETPKNSLGKKRRKVNFENLTQKCEFDKENLRKLYENEIEMMDFPQYIKSKPKQYIPNNWISQSFNAKFQMKSPHYRV